MSKTEKEMIADLYLDCDNQDMDAIFPDMVKQPKHYMFFDTEVIEIIKASMTKEQFIGYCKGNSIKYRLRAGKKDDTLQDIAKAKEYEKFYLQLSNATDKDS